MEDLHRHGHTNDPEMSAIAVWRPMLLLVRSLPGFSLVNQARAPSDAHARLSIGSGFYGGK
jgi:hypothetical protein